MISLWLLLTVWLWICYSSPWNFILDEELELRSNIFSGIFPKQTWFPENHPISLFLLFLLCSICSSIYHLPGILGWCPWLPQTMDLNTQLTVISLPLSYDVYHLTTENGSFCSVCIWYCYELQFLHDLYPTRCVFLPLLCMWLAFKMSASRSVSKLLAAKL